MSAADAAHRLGEVLPAEAVLDGESARTPFALDGVLPAVAVRPQTNEQVADVLRVAAEAGWRVVPWGSGAGQGAALAPRHYDVALSLGGLSEVLDHDVDNLTLTAQAGLTVAQANVAVRERHQMLAIAFEDAPRTLGGVLAANPPPPRRLLYGDVRDQVLGVRVALPDGSLVRYGRKVLKNVAGYDMNKLYLGSQGLLGVVVETTWKLFGLPDERGGLLAAFPGAEGAFACAAELFGSALLPAYMALLDGAAAEGAYGDLHTVVPPGALYLAAGFEGRGVTLRRQVRDVEGMLRRHGASDVQGYAGLGAGLQQALANPVPGGSGGRTAVRLRLGALHTELAPWLHGVQTALASLELPAAVSVDYGAGQVHVALGAPAGTPAEAGLPERQRDKLAALVPEWREALAPQRGFVVLEQAPPALKAAVTPWGDLGGETALLALLQARFDPQGVLAPERFLPTTALTAAATDAATDTTPPAAGPAGT